MAMAMAMPSVHFRSERAADEQRWRRRALVIAMANRGFTLSSLNFLNTGVALPLREALHACRCVLACFLFLILFACLSTRLFSVSVSVSVSIPVSVSVSLSLSSVSVSVSLLGPSGKMKKERVAGAKKKKEIRSCFRYPRRLNPFLALHTS